MRSNFRGVGTFGPRKCGLGTYLGCLLGGLNDFTSEIGRVNVAAIDNSNENYGPLVDIIINQTHPESWISGAKSISDRAMQESDGGIHPTIVYVNHEFGISGLDWKSDDNYVPFLKELRKTQAYDKKLLQIISCLHTIRSDLPKFCRDVTKGVIENSDGTIVLAQTGKEILNSKVYDIDCSKNLIKHLDHGVRMYEYTEKDREEIKQSWGLDKDTFLISTPGLISDNKGIFQYGVPAYANMIKKLEKINPNIKTRKIIRGQCHPDFESHKNFKEFIVASERALNSTGLLLNKNPFKKRKKIEQMNCRALRNKKHGIYLSYGYLEDKEYSKCFGAADLMEFVYTGKQQISSGQISEEIGHGRDGVASKFWHALEMLSGTSQIQSIDELLDPNKMPKEGKIIGINGSIEKDGFLVHGDPNARGLLVDCDRGQQTINQIENATLYSILNKEAHQLRSENAHEKGHEMGWKNIAWKTAHFADYLRKLKNRD